MAVQGMGAKLKMGANSVAELVSIVGLDLMADKMDITTLDSLGWKNFAQGLRDAGEVQAKGFFNPNDTNGQAVLYATYLAGTTIAFSILLPSAMGAQWTFNGFVTAFKTGTDTSQPASFECTIKLTGLPTLLLTTSADLTALALTGTGGALTPAYASGTYSYSYSFTGNTLTITATQAGATINLYVDGVLTQQALASGAPSLNIPFAAIGSKKLTLLVNDPGKTTKTYDIVAIRTA